MPGTAPDLLASFCGDLLFRSTAACSEACRSARCQGSSSRTEILQACTCPSHISMGTTGRLTRSSLWAGQLLSDSVLSVEQWASRSCWVWQLWLVWVNSHAVSPALACKRQWDLLSPPADDIRPLARGHVQVCAFVPILPLLYSNLGVLSSALSSCCRPPLYTTQCVRSNWYPTPCGPKDRAYLFTDLRILLASICSLGMLKKGAILSRRSADCTAQPHGPHVARSGTTSCALLGSTGAWHGMTQLGSSPPALPPALWPLHWEYSPLAIHFAFTPETL